MVYNSTDNVLGVLGDVDMISLAKSCSMVSP